MSSQRRARRHPKPAAANRRPADLQRPAPDEPVAPDGFVLVGRVIGHHGLDGAVRIQSLSDNPNRFQPGGVLHTAGGSRTISSFQPLNGGKALLLLEGVSDLGAARQLTEEWLFAPIDATPGLPPGEYYHYQLIGLAVDTDLGERLGSVQEVLVTGSNDVYVVKSDSGEEILLPAISQVVKEIDLESQTILVHLIDGLR